MSIVKENWKGLRMENSRLSSVRVGDVVVCIDNNIVCGVDCILKDMDLVFGKMYRVRSIDAKLGVYNLFVDGLINSGYDVRRFILLKEYRKRKLERILDVQV